MIEQSKWVLRNDFRGSFRALRIPVAILSSVLLSISLMPCAHARVPSPDFIVYGNLYDAATNQLTQANSVIQPVQVSASTTNGIMAIYVLGDIPAANDQFAIRIPRDDGVPPHLAGMAPPGTEVVITVNQFTEQESPLVISNRIMDVRSNELGIAEYRADACRVGFLLFEQVFNSNVMRDKI